MAVLSGTLASDPLGGAVLTRDPAVKTQGGLDDDIGLARRALM